MLTYSIAQLAWFGLRTSRKLQKRREEEAKKKAAAKIQTSKKGMSNG